MKGRDHDIAQFVLSEFGGKMDFEKVVTYGEAL